MTFRCRKYPFVLLHIHVSACISFSEFHLHGFRWPDKQNCLWRHSERCLWIFHIGDSVPNNITDVVMSTLMLCLTSVVARLAWIMAFCCVDFQILYCGLFLWIGLKRSKDLFTEVMKGYDGQRFCQSRQFCCLRSHRLQWFLFNWPQS